MLRALWPDLEEQHRFDAATLDALRALERSLSDLEQRQRALAGDPAESRA